LLALGVLLQSHAIKSTIVTPAPTQRRIIIQHRGKLTASSERADVKHSAPMEQDVGQWAKARERAPARLPLLGIPDKSNLASAV